MLYFFNKILILNLFCFLINIVNYKFILIIIILEYVYNFFFSRCIVFVREMWREIYNLFFSIIFKENCEKNIKM